MAIRYLPNVPSATHHELNQGTIKHYPSGTYDEWCQLQAKQKYEIMSQGHQAFLVDFTYNEFVAFYQRTGRACDMDALNAFVFWKGSGQKD